jgi:hypothetical protein
MSTILNILTNSKLTGKESPEFFDNIKEAIKLLPIERASFWYKDNLIKEEGDWSYVIEHEDKKEEVEFNVSFDGPYCYFPTLYKNVGVISTIYRYSQLYTVYKNGWHENFRKDIYGIIKAIGGSEIIYVADNACDKLNYYLASAWENVPFEEIKIQMIKEIGQPVTDYSKLDFNKLDYRKINEFFFDDFNDLKLSEKQ